MERIVSSWAALKGEPAVEEVVGDEPAVDEPSAAGLVVVPVPGDVAVPAADVLGTPDPPLDATLDVALHAPSPATNDAAIAATAAVLMRERIIVSLPG
ncbi:hypothetical protein [Catenulispora pinisilvae]|uniref:hypothetical protein n=1 Tax=Catenulispora pinisilvae TaxID=2705253 RepID=UPI0018919115|nr:hypothetical protein [Catenulispora pinisilvae]